MRSAASSSLLVGVLLCSCSALTVADGERIPRGARDLRDGQTTRAEALALLGPPKRLTAYRDGVAFLYEHVEKDERQLGLGLDLVNLPWVKLSFAQGSADRQVLLLAFDRDEVLETSRYVSWRENLGSGASVQLVVVVESVIDTAFLADNWDVNDWGRAMLRTPPETLNTAQSIDLGQSGFELRGMPDDLGQRALEIRPRD